MHVNLGVCTFVARTRVQYGLISTCVHRRAQRCLHVCVHACLVCYALSPAFEKFIRIQAVPEGMVSAVAFPAHGAAWVFAPSPQREPMAPQRGGGAGATSAPSHASGALSHLRLALVYTPGLCSDPLSGMRVPAGSQQRAECRLWACPSSPRLTSWRFHTQGHRLHLPPRVALGTAHQLIKLCAPNQL